ncbi:glutathione metabolism protein [Synechococcus sp. RSCCF101]|uniref:MAPEG family protein n=1 Tax=Synechococcus sp. RSCCF101 TaxID=2511069 RepID=UPI001244FFB9|nr:MAPEG family protein [Synechococcus sp. RSCCF101]QEY31261.1 glutathione metabolism protein [Synechococcus sp. RSCCF101]
MIWPLFAAAIALLFVVLSLRTIRLRNRFRVALGDGDRVDLQRAIRAHANCAEYAPFGLLLLMACEQLGAATAVLLVDGALLLIGRVVHALAVSRRAERIRQRVVGMACTFASLLLSSGLILLLSLSP